MPGPKSNCERQQIEDTFSGVSENLQMTRAAASLVIVLMVFAAGCVSVPSLDGRVASRALDDTADTRLGRAVAERSTSHPGQAGIYALGDAREAFAARALLASSADRSLDVQYYIWNDDETGYLLFEALWQAAERGVRVRLLLDDNNTSGLDSILAALDAHPNIEVRLYNPLFHRRVRAINYVASFSRVNRRMHNKSFTADNQVTIVGGRNVGNEYFDSGDGVWLKDLDVIAVGPVVRDVSTAFDQYWNSESAYPAALLLNAAGKADKAALLNKFAEIRASDKSEVYLDSLRDTPLVQSLLEGSLPMEWTAAQLFCDDPAKTIDPEANRESLLLPTLLRSMQPPQQSFDLVSPYFVPGKEGAAAIAALASRGVKVRILTNSLSATDVAAVHAGYAKRRTGLLHAQVKLYELKPTIVADKRREKSSRGSSSASLHAKTFAVDGERVFVGSFNFDKRSAYLNTELGLLLESTALARRLSATLDEALPQVAYEVKLAADGKDVEWIDASGAQPDQFSSEPNSSALRRGMVSFLSILPIEWLL